MKLQFKNYLRKSQGRFTHFLVSFLEHSLSYLVGLIGSSTLYAQHVDVTFDHLQIFSDYFITQQHQVVYSSLSPTPPLPLAGYLPIIITNTTGLDPSQVFVTITGQQTASQLEQFFFSVETGGRLTPVSASSTTYSPNYSYPLSHLPVSTTGTHDYLVYAPSLNGVRFYFSIAHPMYLASDTLTSNPAPNQILAPTYYAFYDPNYNHLFESVEITFKPTGGGGSPAIAWTASANTTEVDAFGLPIRIGFFSYDPSHPNALTPMIQDPNALPSGFGVGGATGATTRQGILTSVVNGLTAGDLTGATPQVWPRLAIPFYSDPYSATGLTTYLRILSPKQSIGNNASPPQIGNLTAQHITAVDGSSATTFQNYNYPPFPNDYLSNTGYGDVNGFINDLYAYYDNTTGVPLYLSTGGGSPTIYSGTTSGGVLTLTGVQGPNMGQVSTLSLTAINAFGMYSGSQLMSGGPDGTNLGFFFGDAFTIGILPSTVGSSLSNPINITNVAWQTANIGNYYLPAYSSIAGGPWYDLYTHLLHDVAVSNTSATFLNDYGLCYGYDFDDSLGISGTITPVITTPNALHPYLRVTLGAVDTAIPDPYSDPNTYTVTFNFPTGPLAYRQGSTGSWTTATSGVPVSGLQSNRTNPLYVRYTNGQGPTGTHEFIVYLYYQFLIPVGTYNSSEVSVINSTQIVPNSSTPTAFTINWLP